MFKLSHYNLHLCIAWLLVAPAWAQIPAAPNVIDESNLRQGEWVILYDYDWKEVPDTNKAEFYRSINYVSDKPNGTITDYYIEGTKQWEGQLYSDRPDVLNGINKYYYDNGIVSAIQLYDKGTLIDTSKYYTKTGKFSHACPVVNGSEQGLDLILNTLLQDLETSVNNNETTPVAIDSCLQLIAQFNNIGENNFVSSVNRQHKVNYLG